MESTQLTVLKHPLHIEAVSGTCLIVGTSLQICCQLPRSGVIDHPRVVLAYGVCVGEKSHDNKPICLINGIIKTQGGSVR
jgi:hypothetical protein